MLPNIVIRSCTLVHVSSFCWNCSLVGIPTRCGLLGVKPCRQWQGSQANRVSIVSHLLIFSRSLRSQYFVHALNYYPTTAIRTPPPAAALQCKVLNAMILA
jgi:hypothetical protein